MRVLVIGARGKTGSLVVEKARDAGHEVTALIHTTGDAGHGRSVPPGVRVVEGDVQDADAVCTAMDGCDAVTDALGGKTPFLNTDLESSAARIVLAAMQETGARRLIAISVLGAGDSGSLAPFWYEHIFLPTFLHGALPDKNAMEAAVKASSVEWVLVRPPMLTDEPATGNLKIFHAGEVARRLTRADLAQFLVEQLVSDTYLGQAIVIANEDRKAPRS